VCHPHTRKLSVTTPTAAEILSLEFQVGSQ
jgi:hypothetical protein